MSATEERSTWTLPCHFQTLSLMNCKSRAEAFAKSLHSKLKSLGRLTGDGQDEEDDDDGNPFATDSEGKQHQQPASPIVVTASVGIGKAAKRNNEKTHLMSAPHHGSPAENYLSQLGEDELYFDFDISSPESPADQDELVAHRYFPGKNQHSDEKNLVTRQPSSKFESKNSNSSSPRYSNVERQHVHHSNSDARHCSNFEFGNYSNLEFINSNFTTFECCPATATEEESGCISAVSSVITEQDNDEEEQDGDAAYRGVDGFSDFEDAGFIYPWSPPMQPVPTSPTSLMPPDYTSPMCKLSTIVEQITLEESEVSPQQLQNGGEERMLRDCSVDLGQGHRVNAAFNGNSEAGPADVSDDRTEESPFEKSVLMLNDTPDEPTNATDCDDSATRLEDQVCNAMQSVALVQNQNAERLLRPVPDCDGNSHEEISVDIQPEGSETDKEDEDAGNEDDASETETKLCRVCVSPPPSSLYLVLGAEDDASSLSPTPDDECPRRVYRSSSLKTGKTPPGTPNRKKIVRFADAMGLDLEAVKTVFLDDLPTVPSSAFVDLQDADDAKQGLPAAGLMVYNSNIQFPPFGVLKPRCNLVPAFPQPASLTDFIDRVRRQGVCLESAVLAGDSNIRLVIRVLNLDFNKYVSVRYTFTEWASVHTNVAEYVPDSHDGFSDKFATVINAEQLQAGDRLAFAIQYVAQGKEHWDNNYGQNYCFQCFVEQQYQPSPTDDSWVHFL